MVLSPSIKERKREENLVSVPLELKKADFHIIARVHNLLALLKENFSQILQPILQVVTFFTD